MMRLGKAMGSPITIEASVNLGYIATLGCARFVFTDADELTAAISAYLRDPEGHEKMFFEMFPSAAVQPQPTEDINVGVESDRPLGCL